MAVKMEPVCVSGLFSQNEMLPSDMYCLAVHSLSSLSLGPEA